ncbi:MAG: CDP-glucose 4,6-dehydratase [archaeon]
MEWEELKNFFANKKVCITGHTGFKGSWLTQIMILAGADVVGISVDPPSQPNLFQILKLKDKIKHYYADVTEYKDIQAIFLKEKPEIVFHLAAQPIVFESYKNPRDTFEINTLGTTNVLEAIRNTRSVKCAVFITTDKVYKNNNWIWPYREIDQLGSGLDPYSVSKAAAEMIIETYSKIYFNPEKYGEEHNTLIASARAGNVVGGGDWAPYRLINDIVRAIFEKKELVIRNPYGIRPWNYVLEVLEGYMMLAKRLYMGETAIVGAWNFAPNIEDHITVKEIIEIAKTVLNTEIKIALGEKQMKEDSILLLDSTKARRILGWKPKYSAYERFTNTFEWYGKYYSHKENMEEYSNKMILNFFGET